MKILEENIKKSKEYIEQFRNSEYLKLWRKFTWEDFANNYLEKIKERIKNNDKTAKYLLYTIYKNNYKLMLHPIFPYITEYIYQQVI
ncbi:class I tRNA ligase family protein [Candidatus Nanopusillus massiliensis]